MGFQNIEIFYRFLFCVVYLCRTIKQKEASQYEEE